MTVTRPGPRDVIGGLVAAWQNGDALRAAAYFSPDCRYGEAGREPVVGRDAVAAHFTRFFRDGPRWRFDVDDIIVDEQRACVVYRFSSEGANGTWRERAGCAIVSFEPNGAVAAWREYEG